MKITTIEEKLLGYLFWYLLYSFTGTVPAFQLLVQNRCYFIGNCTKEEKKCIFLTHRVLSTRQPKHTFVGLT